MFVVVVCLFNFFGGVVCAWVYLKKDVRSCVLLAFVVDCVCVSYVCLRCFGWPCLVL